MKKSLKKTHLDQFFRGYLNFIRIVTIFYSYSAFKKTGKTKIEWSGPVFSKEKSIEFCENTSLLEPKKRPNM